MILEPLRPSFLGSLPPGEAGTRLTLALMARLVSDFKKHPQVRETALELVSGLAPKDWRGEVSAIFAFVRDHVRYVRDVHDVETLQTPIVTLDLMQGDCDDKSTLLAALLQSVGHKTRFVATGYHSPGAYQHVYVETPLGGSWTALDATVQHHLGWRPRTPIARLVV